MIIRADERARRIASLVSPLAFFASMLCAFGSLTIHGALAVLAIVGLFVGSSTAWVARQRDRPSGEAAPCTVEITNQQLLVEQDGKTVGFDLDDVEAAWADPSGHCVVRMKSGREVALETSAADANEVLRLCRSEPGRRAVPLPYASVSSRIDNFVVSAFGPTGAIPTTIFRYAIPFLLVLMALGTGESWGKYQRDGQLKHIIGGAVVSLLLMSGMALVQKMRQRRKVIVGQDGIEIHGMLKKRFVAWDRIENVRSNDGRGGVVLELEGERIELDSAPGGERMERQIREAMEARGQHTEGAAVEVIDRSGKTMAEWRDALLALTQPNADYRRARLEPERLAQVVVDPASPPDRRLGAAYVLSRMDASSKERVRIAIDGCADASMKSALERAAEGELAEDEIVAAEEREASLRKASEA